MSNDKLRKVKSSLQALRRESKKPGKCIHCGRNTVTFAFRCDKCAGMIDLAYRLTEDKAND